MRVAAVVCLVALAGCGFAGGAGTVTPAEVPNTAQPGLTTGAGLPPGVGEGGVFAPDLLAQAHMNAVSETSYRLTSNRTERYANGSLRSRITLRVALAQNRTYHTWVTTAGPRAPVLLGEPPAAAEYWSNRFTYVRAFGFENRTYNEFSPRSNRGTWRYWTRTAAFGGQTGNAGNTIEDLFASLEVDVTHVGNGTGRVRLRATGLTGDAFAPDEYDSVSDMNLTAVVDASGLVRSAEYTYRATVDGAAITVSRVFRYEDVGSTAVGRPAWYDRATDGQGE